MLIYISGKYSGNIDENIAAARKVAIQLWEMGHAVICPHLNTAHFEQDCKATYEQYIAGDLIMVERCDAIVMLPGWEKSKGAVQEYLHACGLLLPIYFWPDVPEVKK